ncbi:MAG TPA: lipopolysaccharide heptosyltransferase II [Chthoniobacterales bacterium]|nr:lipopolysaccharide heptosyltransferase II [Chthoniobacterales bacterium]
MPNEALRRPSHYIHCSGVQANLRWTPSATRWPKAMLEYLVYLIYRAGFALISFFPLRLLFALGRALGFCGWLLLPRYRQLAFRNIEIAFGEEKSSRQIRRIVRQHFQRLGSNLLCGLKLAAMPLEKVRERVKVDNAEAPERELRSGRPVVFVLSHIGNWELQAQMFPPVIGFVRNSTIYQPLANRYIDRHVRALRARAGVELFDRREGFQKAIELLREGGAIGILSDQHAGDQGLWVPFFGKLASTTSLPALLTKRTGAALLGTAIYTEAPGRWRMVFADRIDAAGDSVEAMTAKANELIATQIRRAPEDGFWLHNRWKTPRPNFLLARYKRGVYLPKNLPLQKLKPFRILIRSSNWLGDAVMSVPAVRAIKKGRTDAHVTILAPKKIAPMWKLISEVDEILSLPNKALFSAVRLIGRQERFDAAILFPNSLRVVLEGWRVPRKVGYRGHARGWLLNQIVREPRRPGPPEHHATRFLRIADDCGANVDLVRDANQAFSQTSNVNGQKLLGLCPGAEYGPAKRWLPECFAEAAAAVSAQSDAKWILFGTKRDEAIGETIATALGDKCSNRIGQTTLDQLIEELRGCRALLTNDTGTMHLAALLGIPIVAIFGSTEPALTGPLGNGHIIIRHHVECSPCFLRECPIDFRCMKTVTVPEVVDAVMSILQ